MVQAYRKAENARKDLFHATDPYIKLPNCTLLSMPSAKAAAERSDIQARSGQPVPVLNSKVPLSMTIAEEFTRAVQALGTLLSADSTLLNYLHLVKRVHKDPLAVDLDT